MEQAFNDLMKFSRAIDAHIGTTPAVPPFDVVQLREDLIDEERSELAAAMIEEDLPCIADSIADTIYVLIGTAIAYGIDLPSVWNAVQEANMAKAGGPVREDGKRLKPPGWTPPDIAGILERQHSIA